MPLSNQDVRRFRAIGHHLKPILIFGGSGLSDSFIAELDARLEDHELIKVRINAQTREDRDAVAQALTEASGAQIVQRIGNVALLYRAAKKPHPRLSNILRAQQG
ncbi:ribosome assembly RNA-binding protein YhbY [Isoalcanivorax beigongshangi]|uniref:Ribosome assembly RNA-binding protein YhbY n=1 Tax=Isoalcanivorax beigongshangi TaxID=3238810 RepID=A0ABV4AGV2_9GAMM